MSNNPTQQVEWTSLKNRAKIVSKLHLNDLFKNDKNRFDDMSVKIDDVFYDYSKQRIEKQDVEKLCALLEKSNFKKKQQALFNGENVNITENRAALHTALRGNSSKNIKVNSNDVTADICNTLDRMKNFSETVRSGQYKGSTGKAINHIVSIGIGGSDLGPRLVSHAIKECKDTIKTTFVSNIDGEDLLKALNQSDPETTLFVIISKSFTTQETIMNANSARNWFENNLPDTDSAAHFVAVCSNVEAAQEFNIKKDNIFPLWDWVNGRFSIWSAVGLSICLQHGFDKFRSLLDGAHTIDNHFLNAPLNKNIPVLMALIGIWNRNFLNFSNLAILPYAQKLLYFPDYLQQLEMESNGKTVDLDGNNIEDYKTNPTLFGKVGTDGQHSFYQMLHQGNNVTPCDFIGVISPDNNLLQHHEILLNHMIAQGQAMMQGKQSPENKHREFEGNRPSSSLLLEKLDAYHLGMLIALYEHKVFVQGVIWNINSFDQFGVELGKELAHKLENSELSDVDGSTEGLFSIIHKRQK